MKSILYITHDGLNDHIGSSQILPYIYKASQYHKYWILSVEKDFQKIANLKQTLTDHKNINWVPIKYPKASIFGFILETIKMISISSNIIRQNKIDIIHCRCYPGTIVGVLVKMLTFMHSPKLLFDIRDFWLDTRIDTRNNKSIYKFLKLFESLMYKYSDGYITLTEKAKEIIINKFNLSRDKDLITVIPCCADFKLFDRSKIERADKIELLESLRINSNKFVLGYLGSLGPDYLLKEMLDVFFQIKALKENSIFLVITNTPEYAKDLILEDSRFTENDFRVISGNRDEMPLYISLFDLSLVFIRPALSKSGCSPTKVAELLSMNVPIIANKGVGDLDALFSIKRNCSVTIKLPIELDEIKGFLNSLEDHPDKSFIRNNSHSLSLENGARQYLKAYNTFYD